MKKFLLLTLLLAGLSAQSNYVAAQSPAAALTDSLRLSHHVMVFGSGAQTNADSVQRMVDEYYYDQFRHSLEPDAPYFLFMNKGTNFSMGIGGSVRAQGWYEWNGYTPGGGFVTSEIPIVPNPADMHAFKGNISGSRLYFKMIGRNTKIGNYQVFLEAKFNGGPSGRDFKLNKAYAIVGDWTVGYANSTFEDPAAQPYTIDQQGVNSEINCTNMLVRWMHTFNRTNVVAASIELPDGDDVTPTATYTNASGYIPNIAAFYQYQWARGQHVRLSAIARFLSYRDLVKGDNADRFGWGVKLSTVFTPADGPVTVYAGGYYGNGIASLTNDLGGMGLDLLGDASTPGRMYAPALVGYYAGLQYNFSHSVFCSASMGEVRFLPGHPVSGDTYRYGIYGAANLCWYVTPRVMVGAEVNLGWHKQMNLESHSAQRAGVMAQFSF